MAVTIKKAALREQPPRFSGVQMLDTRVLEAAYTRMRWIYQFYDKVTVSFSGGKDSLVTLMIAEQVLAELRPGEKVNVQFYDEELIQTSIVDFVKEIAESGRFNFHWYALPMSVGFYVMGEHKPFVSWDQNRKWHRQPPEYAITDIGVDTSKCNENVIEQMIHRDINVKHCTVLGLRSAESIKRYMPMLKCSKSVLLPEGEVLPNFVSARLDTQERIIHAASPIYDWSEIDVFKFFKDQGQSYCKAYDIQTWSRTPMRVASTMHERAYSQLIKMKQMDPLYYEQIRSVYPEIEVHVRYWHQVDRSQVMDKYPHTWDGIRQYIDATINDTKHANEAKDFVLRCERRRAVNLKKNPDMPLGGISVAFVFREVIRGAYVKAALPNPVYRQITQEDIDFEDQALTTEAN